MKSYGTTEDGRILKTQRECILYYLQSKPGRRISQWAAIKEFGFTRLSAIVYDIEKYNGVVLKRERKEVPTRYGATTTITEYWYEEK